MLKSHYFSATLLAATLTVTAAEPDQAAKDYARAIAGVQSEIDAGRIAEATKQLDTTEKTRRSFEYDYLLARTKAEKAAPKELIQIIAKPKTESRYGVLNSVTRQLVFICRDGSLVLHDLTAPEDEAKTLPHDKKSAAWCGAFSADGKTFLVGHENGDVVVWDAATWKVRHTISLNAAVRDLVVAPDGSGFVAEGQNELELWSLGDAPKKIAGVGQRLNFGEGMAFSPKGDQIATGGMFDITLYDAKTGAKGKAMRHASYTMGLLFSPDGKRIASAPRGNVNKFFAIFDIAVGKELFNAGPFANYVVGMAFTPDGTRVAATGCEKVLRLFDAATGEIVLSWKRPECGTNPTFSSDGNLLGWTEPDGYHYIDLGRKDVKK